MELGFAKRENYGYGREGIWAESPSGQMSTDGEQVGVCGGQRGGLDILTPQNEKPIKGDLQTAWQVEQVGDGEK